MEIDPKEVKNVSIVGELHGEDVKMILTDGGLHVFVGKKEKNKKKVEALAASSHRAIGLYEIEKQYGEGFKQKLFKSEHERPELVKDLTDSIPLNHIHDGVKLYSLEKNNKLEYVLSRYGVTALKYDMEIRKNEIAIKNHYSNSNILNSDIALSKSISDEICKKMRELNIDKLVK